jgi:hypothetical protein
VQGGGPPDDYWLYPTRSDSDPGNVAGATANQANYNNGVYSVTQSSSFSGSQNYLTDGGAFSGSGSSYGTFDQGGNVWEWNDAVISGSSRGLRGGSWDSVASSLQSLDPFRFSGDPTGEDSITGFRVASVPEPSAAVLVLLGGGAYWLMRHRVRSTRVVGCPLARSAAAVSGWCSLLLAGMMMAPTAHAEILYNGGATTYYTNAVGSSTFGASFPITNLFLNNTNEWAISGAAGGNPQGRDIGWASFQLDQLYRIDDILFQPRNATGQIDGINTLNVWISSTPFSVDVTNATSTNSFLTNNPTPTFTQSGFNGSGVTRKSRLSRAATRSFRLYCSGREPLHACSASR